MTTRRPPSAAIRMVVRSAAAKLDLRVVVICSGHPFLTGSNGRPMLAHPSSCAMGAGTYSAMGSPPRLAPAALARRPGRGVPHSTTGCRGRYLVMHVRRKNLLTQVLVANLLLMVAAVVAAGVAGNPNL